MGTTPCRPQPQHRLTPLGHSHPYTMCLQRDNPVRNSQEWWSCENFVLCCQVKAGPRRSYWGEAAQGPSLATSVSCCWGIGAAQPHPVSCAGHRPCSSAQPMRPSLAAVWGTGCDGQDPAPPPVSIAWHLLLTLTTGKPGDRVWICYNSQWSLKYEAYDAALYYVPVVYVTFIFFYCHIVFSISLLIFGNWVVEAFLKYPNKCRLYRQLKTNLRINADNMLQEVFFIFISFWL